MRVIVYDYADNKIRGKVRKILKKIGVHAQWSVFEVNENLEIIKDIILREDSDNYRIAVFKIDSKRSVRKLGKDWEMMKFVF